jgi:hypothetical protein
MFGFPTDTGLCVSNLSGFLVSIIHSYQYSIKVTRILILDFFIPLFFSRFAPPPVLDHDSAIAASSYCTSIVNGADLVPRFSVSNLLVTLQILSKVQEKMTEFDINPTDPASTIKFINKLSEGENGVPIMTALEFQDTIRNSQLQVALRKPEHLFVPGRVYLAYNSNNGWKCVETTGTNPIFQSLEVDGGQCFTDHLTLSYYEALGVEYKF